MIAVKIIRDIDVASIKACRLTSSNTSESIHIVFAVQRLLDAK